MRVITRQEWGALPPRRPLVPWQSVLGWVQHWAGTPYIDPTVPLSFEKLRAEQRYHQEVKGANDILYNFLVDGTGQIFEGRGWDYKSGANGNTFWNAHGLAVQYHAGLDSFGGPETALTVPAKAAFRWLFAEATGRFPLLSDVKPHSAVRDGGTYCPGRELKEWIRTLTLEDELTPEDKTWIQTTLAADRELTLQKVQEIVDGSIGNTDGQRKTVYNAVIAANKRD
jgi:N-acetylmuramoyl-L-alanine amidase